MPRFLPVILLSFCACATASAAPPSPINSGLFAFPGLTRAPGSAASAALAGSDRWLGDEPFDNPAADPGPGLLLTPVLQRVSRQDLRADNRNYDETAVFLDVLGGWLAQPAGGYTFSLYVHQPLVRHENVAFTRGINAVQPAVIRGAADMREYRAGLAVSRAFGPLRLGIGGEWTARDDAYEYEETSGSPESGLRLAEFSGGAPGAQAGARWTSSLPWGGPLIVGAAARWVPELEVDGTVSYTLLTGDSAGTFAATREAGWEGGLSAEIAAGPTFRVYASAGGRSAAEWDGFGVTEGAQAEWRIGGAFHDPREPWTVRFGLGQEHQTDVGESRAGVLGLGIGWDLDGVIVDFGVIRRTLERAEQPTSYEDRLAGSARVSF
jgi:hypothetical protein